MARNAKPHFDVHPSVVYQLGESLITDTVQALIELVKNCYDADATYAKVTIDTQGVTEVPEALFPSSGGRIIVEDDGHGMGAEDVASGWLMISNRKKRDLKQAKRTTRGGRTPLGDKGLGRLGVQRLGDNLEIFTKSSDEPGYHFGFSWLDFSTIARLQDVDIHFEEVAFPQSTGTKVIVSKLREIETWRGEGSVKRLERELSRMISPYKKIRNFIVMVEIDGIALELQEISEQVREIAPIRYGIQFDGNTLKISGAARLDFFRPSSQKELEQFILIAESDDGQAFYKFLKDEKLAKTVGLSRSKSKHWFVEIKWEKSIEEIDKIEFPYMANPGPFWGEIDSFDLGPNVFRQQNVFNRISEYRRHIKDLSGIRVYRDGFAIRVDKDWLKLSAQWTSASSYFGLKPDTTLGYIALSARDNINLEETTDREGFKDNLFYRNFYALLSEFIGFTTIVHGFFGRSWAAFRRKRNEELAQVNSRKTVEDISQTIKRSLTDATAHQKNLESFRVRLESSVNNSQLVVTKLSTSEEVTPQLREMLTETLSSLNPLLEEAKNTIKQLAAYLDELTKLQSLGQVLEDRVNALRQQMDGMYETVALGITAEALSHEIFNIADQLAHRTKSAQTHLRSKNISDRPILTFIEYVHSTVISLRKQVSFLSPALRYVREQRQDIDLVDFLNELADFYRERLEKNKVSIVIRLEKNDSLRIRMNKGKLTQIIDNFVLNSEYWLKEEITQQRQTQGTITFDISQPFLRIFDDGRGIDTRVEDALFEPFISAKAKGTGRGLGLFIAKQLLDSEGCSVNLIPERNKYHRFFKFQIDFRGAIYE